MDPEKRKRLVRISAFDQAAACLGDLARVLGQYHAELCKNGFTREEALSLVSFYHQIMLAKALQQPEVTEDGGEEEVGP